MGLATAPISSEKDNMATKATGSELGMNKPPKPPKGYVVSDGVCDGELYEASMDAKLASPDSMITGAEIGEPTNQPGDPWGPGKSGQPDGGDESGSVVDKKVGGMSKSSPSKMMPGANEKL
jgi:hypothetical protein